MAPQSPRPFFSLEKQASEREACEPEASEQVVMRAEILMVRLPQCTAFRLAG